MMGLPVQVIRYAIVGLISNLLLYLIYLLLTWTGLGHKLSMSLLYGVGILQTFVFNKRWTFNHTGNMSSTFVKYISAYLLGYLINILALLLLVDNWGLPHQLVQGVMIFIIAAMLFILQRYWIFRSSSDHSILQKQQS
ncbi:MAG: GtrA family protein [Chromatiaceae bacterium]|nr:GtrA family protein [Chromatiaceae bacterium]